MGLVLRTLRGALGPVLKSLRSGELEPPALVGGVPSLLKSGRDVLFFSFHRLVFPQHLPLAESKRNSGGESVWEMQLQTSGPSVEKSGLGLSKNR